MNEDTRLIAHLMRRAGFGATRGEIEAYAAKGYGRDGRGAARPA